MNGTKQIDGGFLTSLYNVKFLMGQQDALVTVEGASAISTVSSRHL